MLNLSVDIIIVVYNGAKTLEETLKSVIAQSYENKKIIIKDGGSTDGTIDIIKNYEHYIYNWISTPDAGIYDAMNATLQLMVSDYVYFIGSDDTFYNHTALEDFISKVPASHSPKNIYYGNVVYKAANKIYDGEFNDFKFCLRNICHQSILYPRDVFKTVNFDLEYKYLADFVLNLTIKTQKVYHFIYIDQTIAIYNDEGTSGKNIDKQFLNNRLKLIKKAFPFPVFVSAFFRFKLKKLLNG